MAYMRYRRRWPYIATEVGNYGADLVASDGKQLVEVEVKISMADLVADFKKTKHSRYGDSAGVDDRWEPNKFYFAVPSYLKDHALRRLEDVPRYGLLTIGDGPVDNCTVVEKRAAVLHSRAASPCTLSAMVMRASSDLVTLYIKRELECQNRADFLAMSKRWVEREQECI